MSIIVQPEVWDSQFWWEAVETDDRWWFYTADPFGGMPSIIIYLRHQSVAEEVVGTAAGNGSFSGSLDHTLVRPGSALIRFGFDNDLFDDGLGALAGSGATGTINYATGAIVIDAFAGNSSANITAYYDYQDTTYPPLPASLDFTYEVIETSVQGLRFYYRIDPDGDYTEVTIPNEIGTGTIHVDIPAEIALGYFEWSVSNGGNGRFYTGTVAIGEAAADPTYDINLTWTASSPAGTNPIASYRLYRSLNGGAYNLLTTVPAASPRQYTDPLISYDTIYRYKVVAVDNQALIAVDSSVVTLEIDSPPVDSAQ